MESLTKREALTALFVAAAVSKNGLPDTKFYPGHEKDSDCAVRKAMDLADAVLDKAREGVR